MILKFIFFTCDLVFSASFDGVISSNIKADVYTCFSSLTLALYASNFVMFSSRIAKKKILKTLKLIKQYLNIGQ